MDTVVTEYYSVPDPTPPTVPAFRRACGRLPDAGFPCVSERTVFSIRSHTRATGFFPSHEVPRTGRVLSCRPSLESTRHYTSLDRNGQWEPIMT